MPLMSGMRERLKHKNGHTRLPDFDKIAEKFPTLEQVAEKLPSLEQVAEKVPAIERLREELPQWSGQVRERVTTAPATTSVAYSLIGTGAGVATFMIARHRRGFLAWAIPGALLAAGLALVFGGYTRRRGIRIDETAARVREELAHLDPLARARVVTTMAHESIGPLVRRIPGSMR